MLPLSQFLKRFFLTTTRTGILTFLLATTVQAQLKQPLRYEREFKFSENAFTIIPISHKGLFMVRDKDKFETGKKLWEVVFLDTALKEINTQDIQADNRSRLIGYEYDTTQVFLLYRLGETEKSDLELIQIDLKDFSQSRHMIKSELTLSITHFVKAGNSMVFGGYVNKEPALLLFDLKDDNIKVLPGFLQKDAELVDVRTNQNNTFNVILIERGIRDDREVVFQTYDESGKLLLEDKVGIEKDISLQTGITSTLKREDLILLGTWGEGNSRLANGFYALPVDPFGDQKIKYFAHGELEHLLDYQKPNRADRIKEKTKEEVKAGGIPNFTTYVMPFRVDEYEGGFLLLAEIYNPSSSGYTNGSPYSPYYYGPGYSPYSWYYPGYGRLYPNPYSYRPNVRNDEIKTYETVLVSFSPSGKLQWDISLDLDEMKQASMEQITDFYYFNNQAVLLYKKESDLISKWIDLSTNETERTEEKIRLTYPEDEIRSEKEFEGGVKYWYDNAFYVWGFQTIKNVTKKDRVRDVFYINKVLVK